jgi:hypothetical protein
MARKVAIGRWTLVNRLWLVPSTPRNGSSSLSSASEPGRRNELAAPVRYPGFAGTGVADQTIAVVIGRKHLAIVQPHGGKGAVAAAEHGGADVNGVHGRAKRHVGCRIELASVGEGLEQFSEVEKALPVVEPVRKHRGGKRSLNNGHRHRTWRDAPNMTRIR